MKQQFELWGLILTIIPLDLSLIDLTEASIQDWPTADLMF